MCKSSIIILAAGVGSRMKSNKPKVLHSICGKSMIARITEAALQVSDDVHIVLHHQKEAIEAHLREYFGENASITIHTQDCQNFPGTGGALMQGCVSDEKLESSKASSHPSPKAQIDSSKQMFAVKYPRTLVLNGDMPLISAESMRAIILIDAPIVLSVLDLENPSGYGRVVLESAFAHTPKVLKIIEEKDCDEAQKAITLVNAGIYAFDTELLERSLPRLSNDNAQREYYLTDIIALAREQWDSALRDKSLIASRARRLHTPSMRPCARSQSKDFSSQILESCPEMDKQTSAIPRILEEDKQAGREKSCHEQLQLESTFATATLHEPAKDSRSFAQNAQNVATPQAEGFEMRNRGFQGGGEGIYLAESQAPAAESTIYRSKPTPNTLIAPFYGNVREFMGVNSKSELAQAEAIRLQALRQRAMDQGVIMRLPESIYLEEWVEFEGECEIENNVRICGKSVIKHSHIKAGSVIEDSVIEHSDIGPMAHIRPKSHISHTHIGNFVETKSAQLNGVKAGHLSYLGDCEIGSGSNVGAGVITCNYDGKKKHRTIIGQNVFIGSDTQLVAPVEIESSSIIGAGSTITTNVKSGELALSRTKQSNIAGFFHRFFAKS